MKNFKFSSLSRRSAAGLLAVLALLAGCGGGGGGSTPATPAAPVLRSIAVTVPDNATTIPVGAPAKILVATGTYSDGTSKPLTAANGIVWGPTTSTVVTLATNGSLTAKAVGTETVTATLEGVVGRLALTVTAPWVNVAAGGSQTVARKADGNLYSWGSNVKGQLGDSTTIDRNAPVLVAGGGASWKQVAVGDQFVVAIRTDGTLWAWGYNLDGQLGDGTFVNRTVPTQVGKDKDWNIVAAGKAHALALKTTGALYSWGRNDRGQLGGDTTAGTGNRTAPVRVGALFFVAIAAGDAHSLAIQRDTNDVYGWGGNEAGQVGNASKTDVAAPVKIGTLKASWIAAGAAHSAAITTSGTLFAWGLNSAGQLGNNGSTDLQAPAQIGTDNNWSQVAGGAVHTIGLRTDGTVWSWGSNERGQLGTGGTNIASPQQIGSGKNWKSVTAGAQHSFGLRTDDTLWGWGANAAGQLGNAQNAEFAPIPVNVPN
nr:hypothetical protein [uncultured Duganella sp.]